MKNKIILKIKYQKPWAIIIDDFIDGADILFPLYKTKKEALEKLKKDKIGGEVKQIKILI